MSILFDLINNVMNKIFMWLLLPLFFISCKAVDKNILIYNRQQGYPPCEPSIAINPADNNQVIAGSVLNNVHYSHDGGKSWKTIKLNSSHGVFGDPVIFADKDGSFYYCHLADPEGKSWASSRLLESIVVQRSDDGGLTWNDGAAIGANPPKDQDKEWAVADPHSNAIYMAWTEFDKYNSPDPDCETRILFASSSDKGETWTRPISLSSITGDCLDDDETVEGAVPAAGRNGKVFVAWSVNERIYFNHSDDFGKSWLKKEKLIANQPGGWSLPIEGLKRVNGMPVTLVDNSSGIYDGRVYVLWADQREGKLNTNIYLIYSDDDGETWTPPTLIHNDVNETHQFFPWMAIDNSTGFVYVVYYDRKNYRDRQNEVSLAWSYDGGASWQERIISDSPFETPPPFVFFGDYNNISAVGGKIRPIWTRYEDGNLSIWTALIEEKNKNKIKP